MTTTRRRLRAELEDALETTWTGLSAEGSPSELERIRGYLDIVLGAPITGLQPLQQVKRLSFVPGLTARPFWAVERFPALHSLEQHYSVIRSEFASAFRGGETLPQYGEGSDGVVRNNARGRWSALYLRRNAATLAAAEEAYGQTLRLLASLNLGHEALFSVLEGGARIVEHSDDTNYMLTVHMGIIVPPGCVYRVGGEDRLWAEGKCLVFDSSFIHSALNRSTRDRVILIADMWHPDLSSREIDAIKRLHRAVQGLAVRRAA